jgi:hypothetical protein
MSSQTRESADEYAMLKRLWPLTIVGFALLANTLWIAFLAYALIRLL